MRIILILALSFFFNYQLLAQDNPITQEGPAENIKEITHQIFKYPDFVEGSIFPKEGGPYEAKLNYNRVLGQIMAIDRIGKAQPVLNPEELEKIIIAKDTFYFNTNNVLEKLSHFGKANLYLKQTIVYVEKQNNTNNGIPIIIADGSKTFYNSGDTKKKDIVIEGNSTFKFISEYFIANNSMVFYPATKKGFYDLFTMQEKELKSFLRSHSVNFTNINQVETLLQCMNNL